MTTTTEAPVGRLTPGIDTMTRMGGAWLALGSLLLVVGIALHPPPSPDPGEFMATIAQEPTRWMAAHVATAVALSAFAMAGLIVLSAGSRFTRNWWTVSAWAVLIVSALWVTTAAVAEATVITQAAIADDVATFEAWSVFAEAHSAAFGFLALAIAVIAGNETRSAHGTTPVWASWIGVVAGVAAVLGFVLGLGLGMAPGGLVWLVSTIVMSLWTLWFGVTVARSGDAASTRPEEPEPGRPESAP